MLALIAGQGALPGLILDAVPGPVLVFALHGENVDLPDEPRRFYVEHLGTLIADLDAAGVTEICMAGGVTRPDIDPSRIDANTVPLVPRMMATRAAGDDGALRAVIAMFEEHGFAIRAAHELVPDLLPEPGVLTTAQPQDQHVTDATRGQTIVTAMGAADIGQACLVARGQAVAVEALPGTDWMLTHAPDQAAGGILYKAPKPAQDRRVDLPVIGVNTVTRAAQAGLAGIVLEAGGVMMLHRKQVIAAANDAGLFIWVWEQDT